MSDLFARPGEPLPVRRTSEVDGNASGANAAPPVKPPEGRWNDQVTVVDMDEEAETDSKVSLSHTSSSSMDGDADVDTDSKVSLSDSSAFDTDDEGERGDAGTVPQARRTTFDDKVTLSPLTKDGKTATKDTEFTREQPRELWKQNSRTTIQRPSVRHFPPSSEWSEAESAADSSSATLNTRLNLANANRDANVRDTAPTDSEAEGVPEHTKPAASELEAAKQARQARHNKHAARLAAVAVRVPQVPSPRADAMQARIDHAAKCPSPSTTVRGALPWAGFLALLAGTPMLVSGSLLGNAPLFWAGLSTAALGAGLVVTSVAWSKEHHCCPT